MKIVNDSLRINGMLAPCIDTPPIFSYKLMNDGDRQTVYRITVKKDGETAPYWDSGMVESSDSFNIHYNGKVLLPETRYRVAVTVYSEKGKDRADTFFDTGKMGRRFEGIWITAEFCKKRDEIFEAPYLRRDFSVKGGVRRAMLYIAGLGYFEAHINGEKVGDDFLSTPYTAYDKRVLYRAFEVTNMLTAGENAIGVILGNGFYNCFTLDPWQTNTAPWRDVPKLLCDLVIEYENGERQIVKSGDDWKTGKGAITFNGTRHGECYDARLYEEGWDKAGFDDSKWQAPRRVKAPGGLLLASEMEPIRVIAKYPAVSMKKVPEGWLFDVGQNQAGVCLVTLRGKRGDKITLRYCDILTEDGRLTQHPLDCFIRNHMFQTDTYIKATDEPETFHAHFTYHGYQWVEMSGMTEEPHLSDVTALALSNDMPRRGHFETSDETVNRIQKMCIASSTSCCMSVLSADAVREKSSWTGDTGLSTEQLLINFGAERFLEKCINDIVDAQRPCGSVPCIVPSAGWGYNGDLNGPDWSAPVWEVPYRLYMASGDISYIGKYYDSLCRFVDYQESMSVDGIAYGGLGDWCPPFEGDAVSVNMSAYKCPLPVTDNAYYHSAICMAENFATLLGKTEDAERFHALAETVKNAFRKNFYDEKTFTVMGDCQTATAVMVYHGLCEEWEIPHLVEKLTGQIHRADDHLDFGVLGMKAVLNVLGRYGKTALALKMIANPTYPSYANWINMGANTLFECWNGGGSRNQHMFSDVSAFFYKYVAGIEMTEAGYRKVHLHPDITCGLDSVDASIDTPYGLLRCAFTKKEGKTTVDIEIPVGVEAVLSLPEREDILRSAVHFTFQL